MPVPKRRDGKLGEAVVARLLAVGDDRITIDTPISELRVTPAGRKALAEGGALGIAPEAVDLLFAVAYWEDTYGAADDPA